MSLRPSDLENVSLSLRTADPQCAPHSLLLPVLHNAMNLKLECVAQSTHNTRYDCSLPHHRHFPTSTTFYELDSEYASALQRYSKRRLHANHSHVGHTLPHDEQATHTLAGLSMERLLLYIVCATLLVFIACCLCLCLFFLHRSHRKRVGDASTSKQSESEALSPRSSHEGVDMLHATQCHAHAAKATKHHKVPSTSMASPVLGAVQYEAVQVSFDECDEAKNKTKTSVPAILEMANVVHGECWSKEPVSPPIGRPRKHRKHRQRLKTDSLTLSTAESLFCSVATEDTRSYRSGYSHDDEEEEEEEEEEDQIQFMFSTPVLTAQCRSFQQGLPDEDENMLTDDTSPRPAVRRSLSLADLDQLEQRRASDEVDHAKLRRNEWGTYIPIELCGEERSRYSFFYKAPSSRRRNKRRAESYRVRIRADTESGKELEDDVIQQMATDSELSAAESVGLRV